MAITFHQLQELLKGERINYYIAPDRPIARFVMMGSYARHDIVIHIQEDGQFLQFQTIACLACAAGHPHLTTIMQMLAVMNCQRRLVKWGWDAQYGEVVAFADVWIADAQVTPGQFNRMFNSFFSSVDIGAQRLRTALETGRDPGDPIPQPHPAAGPAGAGPTMPPKLKTLLDELSKKEEEKPGDASPGAGTKRPPGPEVEEI